jgi:hypothetical protein
MARRPLYRILDVTPPDSCAAIGAGAWTELANPGTSGRFIGRINNFRPFDATWLMYVSAAEPLPARLGKLAGPGEPALSVEHFEPVRDLAKLQQRLADDQFTDTADVLASKSVTRLAVTVNDAGEHSVFRVNLGARPDRAWARATVDMPAPDRAGVCAAALDGLSPDAATFQASVYLGAGGDRYFGVGWHGPEPTFAGSHRRMAGSNATLLLPVERPADITFRLSVEALNGATAIAVRVNGRDLPPQSLAGGWNDLAWRVAAETWRIGLNDVSIRAIGRPDSSVGLDSAPSLRFRRIVLDWSGSS